MTKPNSEVARWFDAIDQLGGANFGEEVFPGYPGAVVAEGALVSMTWGSRSAARARKGNRSSRSRRSFILDRAPPSNYVRPQSGVGTASRDSLTGQIELNIAGHVPEPGASCARAFSIAAIPLGTLGAAVKVTRWPCGPWVE